MTQAFKLVAATGLHKGDRPYQQDQVLLISHPRAPGCVLGVIADGMGGRSGGREASDQVMLTARQLFARFSPVDDKAAALLCQILEDAHIIIKMIAVSTEQEPHSTMAAFLIDPLGACTWAHLGDSRVYQFRRGHMRQRTRDHSYVQSLVDSGELSEAQANDHPQSNILLGCLGMAGKPPPAKTCLIPKLDSDDILLACSDGLWHYFTPEELGAVLAKNSPRDAVELLVREARLRAHGMGDNLSIVVVRVEAAP